MENINEYILKEEEMAVFNIILKECNPEFTTVKKRNEIKLNLIFSIKDDIKLGFELKNAIEITINKKINLGTGEKLSEESINQINQLFPSSPDKPSPSSKEEKYLG